MRKLNKVIITGGAGFIGSILTRFLLEKGISVLVIDDLSKGRRDSLPEDTSQFQFIKADLRERSNALTHIKNCDWVFHLASQAFGVAFCSTNQSEVLNLNNQINTNVVEAVVENKIPGILAMSSSCVYGDSENESMEENLGFAGEPEKVNWGYGWAKRILEISVNAAVMENKCEGIIVRPVNVYGESYGWFGPFSHVIPSLTKRIFEGEDPLVVWGNGNQARNFIHVEDIVRILYDLSLKAPNGITLNIGSEKLFTVNEIINVFKKEFNLDFNIRYDMSKPTGRIVKSVSSKLMMEILPDFKYSVHFEEGIKRMKDWYFRHLVAGNFNAKI